MLIIGLPVDVFEPGKLPYLHFFFGRPFLTEMGLKLNEKKSIVQLVLKKNEKDVEVLGFAAKVKQTQHDSEPVLITSSSVLQTAEQHLEYVFVEDYTPKTSVFSNPKKIPLRKVTEIKHYDTVSCANYEGYNNDNSFLYRRYSPKGAETLSAYVFDNQEIIELQFEKQEGSYELSNVSMLNKKGFDVKKAKGAPVIYKFEGEINHAVVGVLGSNDNQNGDPVLFPILLEEGIFKGESADSSSGAATSETSNQQVNDNTNGLSQSNIINYYVNVSGNGQVAIGQNPTVNTENHTEKAECAEKIGAEDDDVVNGPDENHRPDQRAVDDDELDRTDNRPVVDICQEIFSRIQGQADIQTVDCKEFSSEAVRYLKLDRSSPENPPPERVKDCRKLCAALKQKERIDIVKELRTRVPDGVTGPLRYEKAVFQNLPVKDKQNLTEAMSGNNELLKTLVKDLLHLSPYQNGYYLKQENPAEKILDKFCQKRRLLVGELYDLLVRFGAAALADEYL